MYQIFQRKGIILNKFYYLITALLLLLSFYWPLLLLPYYTFSICIILYGVILLFKNNYTDYILKISHYSFGLFYITFLSGHFLLLKQSAHGSYYLLLIVLLIWFNDTFAYLFGVLFGKIKLHITASPQKSYAGLLGGILFSILVLFLVGFLFPHKLIFTWYEKIMIGVVFSLIATFADLIESAIKRSVPLKDSSNLIPGHGGVLDRFDTWFITIPLFYYFLKMLGKI